MYIHVMGVLSLGLAGDSNMHVLPPSNITFLARNIKNELDGTCLAATGTSLQQQGVGFQKLFLHEPEANSIEFKEHWLPIHTLPTICAR